MKLGKLLEHINIVSSTADPDLEITDLCYDSRSAEPGCAFIAVRGYESDGHRYISNAVKAGASVVICEESPADDIPYVVVDNSRLALALMSCAFFDYPSSTLKVIGVTGTSGKTTSTHLIKHILEESLHVKVGLVGTNGNMIGDRELHTEHTTPESYELQKLFREMADEGCAYVVMEVSSHALVLDRVTGTSFYCAAYTNLSQDHLDFHKTMDAYAEAKSALFGMSDRACINLNDRYAPVMLKAALKHGCSLLTTAVGQDEACDRSGSAESVAPNVRDTIAMENGDVLSFAVIFSEPGMKAENLHFTSSSVSFDVSSSGETLNARLSIPGLFSIYNAMTALSVSVSCGIPLQEAVRSLGTASGVKGRMESVPTGKEYTVLIDYSHKPDALEKALKTLRPVTVGKLTVLFGCGGDRDRLKRPIMGQVACRYADTVVVTSDNPRTEEPDAIISEILKGIPESFKAVKVITDRIEAIHWTLDNAASGDVILLAGKGHEDYQIVGHEKHHMDEREIVADHLRISKAF